MDARAITDFILKHKNQFWLLFSIAVAFALRVYSLGVQSLWVDEGTSVALAPLSLSAIVEAASKDIHPPLYYVLLHFWMPAVGQTEFAVRFLSVIAGVLIVAVTFRIARLFFDLEVAIIAAFLSAFSPFQVYYSQETRMYIWVTLFAAISIYALARVLFPTERREASGERIVGGPTCLIYWLLYVLTTLALLYTQYVGAFVFLAGNLFFLVWLILGQWVRLRDSEETPRREILRTTGFWIIANGIVILGFAPWYLYAGSQLATWPSISEPMDLPSLLWRLLNVFSTGVTLEPGAALPIVLAFGILLLFGMRYSRRLETVRGLLLLSFWLLVPVAVMYIVSLSRPAYNDKFLLLATPPFFVLSARGLADIHPGMFLRGKYQSPNRRPYRLLLFAISVAAAVGFIPPLNNYYWNPHYARDDYRGILQKIDANARAGDGILVHDKGQIGVVRYYLQGSQPLFLLPRLRPVESAAAVQDVGEILQKTRRLFAIYFATGQGDPQGVIEGELAKRAFKAVDEWHGNVRFTVYGVAGNPSAASEPVGARVGEDVVLESFRLDSQALAPGDVLALTLNWRVQQDPQTRNKVFVHLLNGAGQVVAQRDGEPVADRRMTTTWKAGEIIQDNYGVWIDSATLAGSYAIEVGMYREADRVRLPILASDGKEMGDHIVLETVKVSPMSVARP